MRTTTPPVSIVPEALRPSEPADAASAIAERPFFGSLRAGTAFVVPGVAETPGTSMPPEPARGQRAVLVTKAWGRPRLIREGA